ncbi:MAG: hypothetical protein C4532_03280 [Candidatus Abyssobacteria bacterium SURF_17]|uniref:Guanylate cyclase domain-containing protein n=1 Tax=Candidatus Abyssobacteria bacterium SURF_17 TaxID=2093361 RepID=A0A419F6E6_9BACT|nr:MAG: hypothetical protein C4532_03280 [Candidatus Abyssubacteria bacterium SURF_17]
MSKDEGPLTRWSLYIDIEGFGATYEEGTQGLISLGALMEGIYRIGTICFPESPDRIFAHQIGDGFILVGEFGTESLERPLSIAIALMRHVLMTGGVAKATISEGTFGDIRGCYPEELCEALAKACGRAVRLGRGVMTIFTVMGTALINAHRLSKTPSGSLIVIRRTDLHRLPPEIRAVEHGDMAIVDWIHTLYPQLNRIIQQAGLHNPDIQDMERYMKRYMDGYLKSNETSDSDEHRRAKKWVDNTGFFLNLART